jgi:tetratricopeptide (TPR) repeat protein
LEQYAQGHYDLVAPYLTRMVDVRVFLADLKLVSTPWLSGKSMSPRQARQALAGFALENAGLHLANQAQPSIQLLQWARSVIRLDVPSDEFDRRWYMASIDVFEGAVLPADFEAHLVGAEAQIGPQPFGRALAIEQRTAPFVAAGASVGKVLDAAALKYEQARADPCCRAKASLHLGYTELRRARYEAALKAFGDVDASTADADLLFLSKLFEGRTLESLGRAPDAESAYRAALSIAPTSSSASVALTALLFREGRGREAEEVAEANLAPHRAVDPWWNYWVGDFRQLADDVRAMRQARQ